ncbi:unnamed protein product, partial [Rhizoctonia solani]
NRSTLVHVVKLGFPLPNSSHSAMPSLSRSSEPTSSIIQAWEGAVTSLAGAVANYLTLSNLLETSLLSVDNNTSNLVARTDWSLQTLQNLNQQLTQAQMAVAKARNRLASPLSRLPEEVLSNIFMCAVYDREDNFNYFPGVQERVQAIYQQLHNLMGVCTVWRNICVTRQAFWSIVPMVDPNFGYGLPRLQSTELSLQRAGNQGLDLAIFLQDHPDYPSEERLATLIDHFSRFRTINIHSRLRYLVFQVLIMLLQHGAPEMVSQLSLCYLDDRHGISYGYSEDYCFNHEQHPVLRQFSRLMSSLSALQISNILFDWRGIAFSSRLVILN